MDYYPDILDAHTMEKPDFQLHVIYENGLFKAFVLFEGAYVSDEVILEPRQLDYALKTKRIGMWHNIEKGKITAAYIDNEIIQKIYRNYDDEWLQIYRFQKPINADDWRLKMPRFLLDATFHHRNIDVLNQIQPVYTSRR
jgi:hypothetical protein